MRKQKGITLIALIITIIVLLILAGISIATLTGENGILTQANKAKEETIIAREKEGISVALTEYMSRIITAETDEEINSIILGLEEIMRRNGNDVDVGLEPIEQLEQYGYLVTYNDTGNRYIVKFDENGQMQIEAKGKIEIAKNIVDGAIYGYDEGGYVLLEKDNGEVIGVNDLTETSKISNVDISNSVLITTSGIKQASGKFMIDREGKVYNFADVACLNDMNGSALAGKKVTKISAYENSVIAIDEEGKLYSYGDNYYGKLGNGTTEDITTPICISDMTNSPLNGKNIVDLYDNWDCVIAKDSEGKLYSWGYNYTGELGNGTTENSSMPICISDIQDSPLNGKNIVDVYTSGSIVVAKDSEGKLYTWGGYNDDGQLGNGTTENSYMPICISDITNSPLNGKNIIDVYVNWYCVIAKDREGKLYSWGYNGYGRLGNGTTENSSMPICISDITNSPLNGKNIVDVYIYGDCVIARGSEGKLYSWGGNKYGQLGNGTTENSSMPICISDIQDSPLNGKNIVKVDFGYYNMSAIDNEGKLYKWGSNKYGQLGYVLGGFSSIPICISDMENSKLHNKKVKKCIITHDVIELYITEDNKAYYHYVELPKM